MKVVRTMTATKLLQLMDELLSANRLLLELANQKRRMILNNDVNELTQCFHKELRVLEHISGIESDWRSTAVEFLAKNGKMTNDRADLDRILQSIRTEEERNQLRASREQLTRLIDEIKQCNEQNRQLIESSLEYINHMVELYQDPGEQDFTYGNPAAAKNQAAYGSAVNRFESRA